MPIRAYGQSIYIETNIAALCPSILLSEKLVTTIDLLLKSIICYCASVFN
jgi:hypothetical protein